jgi:hypothetical protein
MKKWSQSPSGTASLAATQLNTQLNNGPKTDSTLGVDRVILIDIFRPVKDCQRHEQ